MRITIFLGLEFIINCKWNYDNSKYIYVILLKKRNKVIQWVGKINKKLKDEKIIKDWRDEYYRYAGRSLKLLADDIDESYDFSNNLGYLKNIIEIIHNDKLNETHLENYSL